MFTPKSKAMVIVYRAEKVVKFVRMEPYKLVKSDTFSANVADCEGMMVSTNRQFGNQTAMVNTTRDMPADSSTYAGRAQIDTSNFIGSYWLLRAISMICLTALNGCAPESGNVSPFAAITTLHGVPCPPEAMALSTSS